MIKFYQTARKCLTVLLVFGFAPIFAQQVVSGKVTSSDDGSPLPGVNILEKGTTNGTVSDGDGSFKISVITRGKHVRHCMVITESVSVSAPGVLVNSGTSHLVIVT